MRFLLLATSTSFAIASLSCGSNARPDAATSSAASSPTPSAAPSARDARAASSAPTTPSAVATTPPADASALASASAAPAAPPVPWACAENRFETVGRYKSGPELDAPTSRDELPAPFTWQPCAGSATDCSELDLGNASDANVAFDVATPRGPLFLVYGGTPLCSYVLSVDLDGNVVTGMELRDPSQATLDTLVAAEGAYMVHVDIVHVGEQTGGAWLIGSALTPPATALAEEGEETNDLVSDHLWLDRKKGSYGILGSAKAKAKFDKLPKAYALVHNAVLAMYDDATKITVRSVSDETDALTVDDGHKVVAFDASPNLLAWVESSGSECTLRTSPFAITPMGRAASIKPKDLAKVPCETATNVAIEKAHVLVGDELVQLRDGKKASLAAIVCGGDTQKGCVHDAVLGATDANLYFRVAGKVRRVPIASVGLK